MSQQRHEVFQRAVTECERWTLAHPPATAPVLQTVVEGVGRLEADRVAAALAVAGDACPGSRLRRSGRRWIDSGVNPPLRVVERPSGLPVQELPELSTPLRRGITCEVLLCQGAGQGSALVFRSSHAVMDARGQLLWIEDVFRALRGQEPVGAASGFTDEDLYRELNVPAMTIDEKPQYPSPVGRAGKRFNRTVWRRKTIDGCHPALVAKIATALHGIYGLSELHLSISFDLRRHKPDAITTGTMSTADVYEVRADETWEQLHERMLANMAENKELSGAVDSALIKLPLPVLRTLLRVADRSLSMQDKYVFDTLLSHHGRVELASFAVPGFHAESVYSLANLAAMSAPEIQMLEYDGRTELTFAAKDGPGVAERVEAVLDALEEALSPRAWREWEGNQTAVPTDDATLVSLLLEQARRTPDAVAVSDAAGAGDLTYARLVNRSAVVAGALRASGIGPGDRVGIVGGRSADSIVGIWGVLRAGAAYLPIDEQHPDTRVESLLADAGAVACVVEGANGGRGCFPDSCRTVDLGALRLDAEPDWTDIEIAPDAPANIIYTSGSTGAPKGSELEHRGLVNCIRWVGREARLDETTRMPLVASLSFDMCGYAIFLSLLHGGTVLPVRDVNAVTLRTVIIEGGANVLAITPSHLEMINDLWTPGMALRTVMTGGELLRRSTALRARDSFGCRILCQWGPSEASIVNASHEFDPERDTEAGVPFGGPGDNNTMFLLDPLGRFVPPGEPGEVHLGGLQVGRGYLNRPELNREKFVRLADGRRVYRTGDIARRLPSGAYAFVGRVDDQVKILGHRIEPAEVAQAIEGHPGVAQAAVIARKRPGQHHKELVGYVVAAPGADTAQAVLNRYLADLLPHYMIPAAIVTVPQIPRTPAGKTDARALPDPFAGWDGRRAQTEGGDPVADAVATIWARILGTSVDSLDPGTDFYQLGGNSLLLLSMVTQVARDVVGTATQGGDFLSELAPIITNPTLGRTIELARGLRGDTSETPDPRVLATA